MSGFADRGQDQPGRPEGLPHTAAIKRNAGEVCQNCCLTVLGHFPQGCETLSLTAVSDRPTLGSDFDSRNRAVGPHAVTLGGLSERRIAPFGGAAAAKWGVAVCLKKRASRIWGRFAAQRGQAPSPQRANSYEILRLQNPGRGFIKRSRLRVVSSATFISPAVTAFNPRRIP